MPDPDSDDGGQGEPRSGAQGEEQPAENRRADCFCCRKRFEGGNGQVTRPVQGRDVSEKPEIGPVDLDRGHKLGNDKPRQNDVEQWEAAGFGDSEWWRQYE